MNMKTILILLFVACFSFGAMAGDCDGVYDVIFEYENEPTVENAKELIEFFQKNADLQLETYRLQKIAMSRLQNMYGNYPDYIKNLKLLNLEGKCFIQAVSDIIPGLRKVDRKIRVYASKLEKNDYIKYEKLENTQSMMIRQESYIIQAQLTFISLLK